MFRKNQDYNDYVKEVTWVMWVIKPYSLYKTFFLLLLSYLSNPTRCRLFSRINPKFTKIASHTFPISFTRWNLFEWSDAYHKLLFIFCWWRQEILFILDLIGGTVGARWAHFNRSLAYGDVLAYPSPFLPQSRTHPFPLPVNMHEPVAASDTLFTLM